MALNLNTRTEYSKSPELLVIMDAQKSTVLKAPGTGQVFHTTNRKYAIWMADQMQKETGVALVVVPYLDAVEAVTKHPANQPPLSSPISGPLLG